MPIVTNKTEERRIDRRRALAVESGAPRDLLMAAAADCDADGWPQLVEVRRRDYALYADRDLESEDHAMRWLTHDAVMDTSYPIAVRARSWNYAAAGIVAVEEERARRRRFGMTNPAFTSTYSDEYIQRLKDAADLEREIGLYVDLRRVGSHLKGRCPFHDDRTPSLVAWPEIAAWRCFGCGARGDVITWLQNIHADWTFRDAVMYLEGVTGVRPDQRRRIAIGIRHDD